MKSNQNTEFKKLVDYYNKCWFEKLKSGLIDYSDIDDSFRANSVLERYNDHVKDNLPRSPNWAKSLEFLKNKEDTYVRESYLAEQKGETMQTSMKFGQTYLPKVLKKKSQKQIEEEKQKEEVKIESTDDYPNKRKPTDNMTRELMNSLNKTTKKMKLNVSQNENESNQNEDEIGEEEKVKIV